MKKIYSELKQTHYTNSSGEENIMWTIVRIDDADYGCEERLPGEPLMVLVTIEREDGKRLQFEVKDDWLIEQGLDEGDEWTEDIEVENLVDKKMFYDK